MAHLMQNGVSTKPTAIMKGVEDNETKPFRLLDLPPELWAKIGRMAVDECQPLTPHNVYKHVSRRNKTAKTAIALTRTCRALRDEILPYFYETKVSMLFVPRLWTEVIAFKWAKGLPLAHRVHVQGMVLMEYGEMQTMEQLQKSTGEKWDVKIGLTGLPKSYPVDFAPYRVLDKYRVKFLE